MKIDSRKGEDIPFLSCCDRQPAWQLWRFCGGGQNALHGSPGVCSVCTSPSPGRFGLLVSAGRLRAAASTLRALTERTMGLWEMLVLPVPHQPDLMADLANFSWEHFFPLSFVLKYLSPNMLLGSLNQENSLVITCVRV